MSNGDQRTSRLTRLRSSVPGRSDVLAGTEVGGCAALAAFVVTYILEGPRVRAPARPLVEYYFFGVDSGGELNVGPAGPVPAPHQFAAWQFLSLHGAGFERRSQVAWTLAPPEAAWLVFVPALLVLAAGGALVIRSGANGPRSAAKTGATVAFGYLPIVALLAFGSRWNPPDSVAVQYFGMTTIDARPVETVGVSVRHVLPIAGVVYPLGLGAVGGCLVYAWREGDWPTRRLVAGTGAFLVGWGGTVLRTLGRDRSVRQWEFQVLRHTPEDWHESVVNAAEPDAVTLGTWQYHRLHAGNVDVRYPGEVADGVDWLVLPELSVSTGFDPVFLFAPGVLVTAGAVAAVATGSGDVSDSALAGSGIALGYLPLSLLTTVATTWRPEGAVDAVLGVGLIDAFLVTGLAFPVAFGAVGGVAARSLGARARRVVGRVAETRR